MKKSTKKQSMNFKIIANCPVSGKSMGGGDRIGWEMVRFFQKWGDRVSLFGCSEALEMAFLNNLKIKKTQISNFPAKKFGVILAYLLRTTKALFFSLPVFENDVVYSASEFLPDLILPWKIKRKRTNFTWAVGLYLIAKNPFKAQTKFNLRSILFWLGQKISFCFLKKYADLIFVLCKADKKILEKRGINKDKIKVISGGVNLGLIKRIKEPKEKIYDGVFLGRFHPQKGLPDLIKTWERVVKVKKEAKLAIIGWGGGFWQKFLFSEIKKRNLEKNVTLLGFLDGEKKFETLKKSKVFVFPSTYESWGLVAIEAMACSLPVVSYNLPIFQESFGKALIKSKLGDYQDLAKNILKLLKDDDFYQRKKEEGKEMAEKYDFFKVIKKIKGFILKIHPEGFIDEKRGNN